MKIAKFKYVFGLVLTLYPLNFSWGMQDDANIVELRPKPMPFKLGFEFQEANNLCEWAKPGHAIQKKPLFFMQEASEVHRRLWTLVIDGQDIEFVLEPFAHHEKELLEKAVASVSVACHPLIKDIFSQYDLEEAFRHPNVARLLAAGKETNVGAGLRESIAFSGSFEMWKNWLKSHEKYKHTDDDEFKQLWESNPKLPVPPDTLFRFAKMEGAKTITFNEWISKIESFIFTNEINLNILIENEYFEIVKNKTVKRPQALQFKPQATIQFPLEYSIPLFLSIFDFRANSAPITAILDSLPFLNDINEETVRNVVEKHFTKECGLVFLHALTISGITSKHTNTEGLLGEIVEKDERYRQVDAKMNLEFMSRRPFSDMWNNIKKGGDNFWRLYRLSMHKNKIFASRFFKETQDDEQVEWVDNIYPNYAEEFFSESGDRLDLSLLHSFFIEGFGSKGVVMLDLSGPSNIEKLLKKGMITPIMIRNLDPTKVEVVSLNESRKSPQETVEPYYPQSIESVENPRSRYIFDPKGVQISEQVYLYDTLSPPLLLNQNDAMGFFRNYNLQEIQEYGEAIIEIRSIQTAFSEFREFLTQEDKLLGNAQTLFNFLMQINETTPFSDKNRHGILTCILERRN